MFMHGMRYIFGHPIPFVVVFSLLAALLFYLAALPGHQMRMAGSSPGAATRSPALIRSLQSAR
jgi:hypothetical protein